MAVVVLAVVVHKSDHHKSYRLGELKLALLIRASDYGRWLAGVGWHSKGLRRYGVIVIVNGTVAKADTGLATQS